MQALTSFLVRFLAIAAIVGIASSSVWAAADSLSVTVSPPIRELNVQPGQSLTQTFDVTNAGTDSVTLYPLARDFEASLDPESSSPQIVETAKESSTTVASWIHFVDQSQTVAPGRTASFEYSISVPGDAAAGGHFGGVFVSTQSPAAMQGNGVGIETRIGSLLLLTVDGTVIASAKAVSFDAVNAAGKPQSLFTNVPIHLKAVIANTGNEHLQPTGSITVKNMFGAQVLEQTFNESGSRVLPGSQHAFTQTVNDSIGWGRFTAMAVLTLKAPDGTNVPLTLATSFWVLPVLPIAIGIGVILLLIIVFKLWLKRHDRTVQSAPPAPPQSQG